MACQSGATVRNAVTALPIVPYSSFKRSGQCECERLGVVLSLSIGMKNPFPGMNPWLEEYWQDVHASLLVYARDQLNIKLPQGFQARIDERLAIDAEPEMPR